MLVDKYHKCVQQFDSCLAHKMTSLCSKMVRNSKHSSVDYVDNQHQAIMEVVLSPHLLQFYEKQVYTVNALLSGYGQCLKTDLNAYHACKAFAIQLYV